MRKGDIVLIPFPFTDLTGAKNRPALVLVDNQLDITVSFITTQLRWREACDIALEPTQGNGLKKPSLIRVSKLTTLDKDLVIGKLGQITDQELEKVNSSLIELFKLG